MSVLSYRTQHKLANLLMVICQQEVKIEVVKQLLAEIKDFEPYTAFKRLDRFRNGYLSINEIETFLLDNQVRLTQTELFGLFNHIDKQQKGTISFNEFLHFVLPQENETLKTLCQRRNSYHIGTYENLSKEQEWSLAKLFKQQGQCYSEVEKQKELLATSLDFSPQACFSLIDKQNRGFLSQYDIDEFMNISNNSLSYEESWTLFRILQGETQDGRVSYRNFIDQILSKEYPKVKLEISRNPIKYQADLQKQILKQSIKRDMQDAILRKSISQERNLYSTFQSDYTDEKKIADIQYKQYVSQSNKRYFSPQAQRMQKNSQSQLIISKSPKASINYSSPKPKTLDKLSASKLSEQKNSLKRLSSPVQLRMPSEISKIQKSIQKQASPSYKRSMIQDNVKFFSNQTRFSSPNLHRLQDKLDKSNLKNSIRKQKENYLVSNLRQLLNNEREIEEVRQQLALRTDFNLMDGFRLFDVQGKGFFTCQELERCLRNLGCYAQKEEYLLFFRRFDQNGDGIIKYSDYLKYIVPKSTQYANLLKNRRPQYPDFLADFSFSTLNTIQKLMSYMIEAEVDAEKIRQIQDQKQLFDIYEAFQTIDQNCKGNINADDLNAFLLSHDVSVLQSDLMSLVQRFDKNQNGKISYSEFINEFTPKSTIRF